MAVYVPVRPRWNPRGVVVNYVAHGQLCVRSWPKRYRDANTLAQRHQRGKMVQVCGALPYVKALLAIGYSPVVKPNGRQVGAYHAAVSVALREWFDKTPDGDAFNPAKIQLTDGARALPEGLAVARGGDELRVAWRAAVERRAPALLLAAREPSTNQWISIPIALERGTRGCVVTLPRHWAAKGVEVWVAFAEAGGRARTRTRYVALRPAVGPVSPMPGGGKTVALRAVRLAFKGRAKRPVRGAGSGAAGRRCACKFRLLGRSCLLE